MKTRNVVILTGISSLGFVACIFCAISIAETWIDFSSQEQTIKFITEHPLGLPYPAGSHIHTNHFVMKRQAGSCNYEGYIYKDGAKWKHKTSKPGADPSYGFVLHCSGGRTFTVGCVENDLVVPIDSKAKSNVYAGYQLVCAKSGFSYELIDVEENCAGHKPGDTFVDGFYQFECTKKGLGIKSCADAEGKVIEKGVEFDVGTYRLKCFEGADGDLVVEAIGCYDEHGSYFKVGEKVRGGAFTRTCEDVRNNDFQTSISLDITECCEPGIDVCIEMGTESDSVNYPGYTFICKHENGKYSVRYENEDGETITIPFTTPHFDILSTADITEIGSTNPGANITSSMMLFSNQTPILNVTLITNATLLANITDEDTNSTLGVTANTTMSISTNFNSTLENNYMLANFSNIYTETSTDNITGNGTTLTFANITLLENGNASINSLATDSLQLNSTLQMLNITESVDIRESLMDVTEQSSTSFLEIEPSAPLLSVSTQSSTLYGDTTPELDVSNTDQVSDKPSVIIRYVTVYVEPSVQPPASASIVSVEPMPNATVKGNLPIVYVTVTRTATVTSYPFIRPTPKLVYVTVTVVENITTDSDKNNFVTVTSTPSLQSGSVVYEENEPQQQIVYVTVTERIFDKSTTIMVNPSTPKIPKIIYITKTVNEIIEADEIAKKQLFTITTTESSREIVPTTVTPKYIYITVTETESLKTTMVRQTPIHQDIDSVTFMKGPIDIKPDIPIVNEVDTVSPCPDKWIYHEDECYFVSLTDGLKKNYNDSAKYCEEENGFLVKLTKEEERNFLVMALESLGFWIGSSSLKNRRKRENNILNKRKADGEDDCPLLRGVEDKNLLEWIVSYKDCSEKEYFICQKNSFLEISEQIDNPTVASPQQKVVYVTVTVPPESGIPPDVKPANKPDYRVLYVTVTALPNNAGIYYSVSATTEGHTNSDLGDDFADTKIRYVTVTLEPTLKPINAEKERVVYLTVTKETIPNAKPTTVHSNNVGAIRYVTITKSAPSLFKPSDNTDVRPLPIEETPCPEGYDMDLGYKCIVISGPTIKVNFAEAIQRCQRVQGSLLVLDSTDEWNLLVSHLKKLNAEQYVALIDGYYVGLQKVGEPKDWKWDRNDGIVDIPWLSKHRQFRVKRLTKRDPANRFCGEIRWDGKYYGVDREYCDVFQGYMCERLKSDTHKV